MASDDDPQPGVPDLGSLALSPLTIGAVTVGAFTEGEPGVDQVAETVEGLAAQPPEGKFSKADSYYVPLAPPPVFWEYRCSTCRFYNPEGENVGTCDVVGQEGDPLGGEAISPDAYCAWWVPREGDEPFDWIERRTDPE